MGQAFNQLVYSRKIYESEVCRYCDAPLKDVDKGCFVDGGISRERKALVQAIHPVCYRCFAAESAILEAEIEGRRFTRVGLGIKGLGSYEGDRCACGRSTHSRLGFCVLCWREHRMLDKQTADAIFNRKLIHNLKKELANGNSNQDNRTTS